MKCKCKSGRKDPQTHSGPSCRRRFRPLAEEQPSPLHSIKIASPTRNVAYLVHSGHQLPENTQEGLRPSISELKHRGELKRLSPICLRRDRHRQVVVPEERLVELLVANTQQRNILRSSPLTAPTSPVKLSVGRSATKIKRRVER